MCQLFQVSIGSPNLKRIYELEVKYNSIHPDEATTMVRQISQKLLVSSKTIGGLYYLHDEKKDINGSRVVINDYLYDLHRASADELKFCTDFTSSNYKRIVDRDGEMIGYFIDIYLNSNACNLSLCEIQNIFKRNEKTLLNMVPDHPEYHFPEPANKAWQLRPQEDLGCQSMLHHNIEKPDQVNRLLDGCQCNMDLDTNEGQAPNLIQEVLWICDEKAKGIIREDTNLPVIGDFSQDLSLRSPIALCFEGKTNEEIQTKKSIINRLM